MGMEASRVIDCVSVYRGGERLKLLEKHRIAPVHALLESVPEALGSGKNGAANDKGLGSIGKDFMQAQGRISKDSVLKSAH